VTVPPSRVALAERIARAGHDWLVPDWEPSCNAGIGAFATTRRGGVSTGVRASLDLALAGDGSAAERDENHRRVAAFLPSAPVLLRQVHGRDVITLDRRGVSAARIAPPVADAAVTALPGVVCAVLTADCLPVLFADRDGRAVGAAHAGWRGLAAGVLEATVAALAQLGVPAPRLAVWLGPAIGPAAFEVGADVVSAFCAQDAAAASAFVACSAGKWRADLYALARRRLKAAGVARITGGTHCTFSEDDRFFSFRRDRETGRQGAFVWRQS
jgi:YfiH family protein